ncbi:1599_t:CDS:2 [Paraglomus occultum]|uniref:1599_t:CDS:1 n=1 Tax=Paraglomus occultum TaxID=144539 RepID=A0A9N9F0P8_9GLOM|nr:1599_t:CDS:2 [Paraglomus occultum]
MADYAKILRSLAKEANVNIPKDAFRTRRSKLAIEGTNRCPTCNKARTSIGWCKPCDTKALEEQFGTWTSGNEELDKFIQETQSSANTPLDFMRWIEYDAFTDIEFIAKGGFGSVFAANSSTYGKVALKFLDNSETLTKDFLDELRAHHRCSLGGNILRHEKLVYVTDLGMCRPVNESADTDIYGVLPYVAPEVLRGDPYTEKSDIYSLGMIMWELSSNQPPFADRAHDYSLAVDVCNGLRPPIIAGTPKNYMAAMLRCWDADPSRRPQASELLAATYKWRFLQDGTAPFQGPKKRNVKTIPVKSPTTTTNVHPQAFYTSRLLHFPKLPEPRNSDTFVFFDPATGETSRMLRKQRKHQGEMQTGQAKVSAATRRRKERTDKWINEHILEAGISQEVCQWIK